MESNWPTSPISACAVGDVERRQRGAGQVVRRPELCDARDGERLRRALQKTESTPRQEPVLLRRPQVHHDVVRRRWLSSLPPDAGPRCSGWDRTDSPSVGAAPGADGLAVVADDLRVAGHRALGLGPRPATACTVASSDCGTGLRVEFLLSAELRHASHLEVDVLVDVAEQRVECVVERVGQHEGPGDERHPRARWPARSATSRSLCASRPLIVTFHMSGAQLPHPLEHRVGRRVGQLVDDLPVAPGTRPGRRRRPRGRRASP